MKIQTLRYIHDMLIVEDDRTRQLLNFIRKERNDAEDADDAFRLETLQKEYEELYTRHTNAYNALQDFESQEW